MKTTRARRPQPAIREQNTARQDADRARQGRSSSAVSPKAGKPAPAGRRQRGHGSEWLSAKELAQEGRAAGGKGAVRRKSTKTEAESKPAVPRAKRMQVRPGSQNEQSVQKQLRQKRLPSSQLNDERLQKALAFSGYGSRREMEEVIAAGRVSINGKVAGLGDKVHPGDEVRYDGKRVNVKWPDRLPRIVLYHKQEGEMVTRDDPEGRATVFDRLPRVDNSKWVAIGRLDFNTSGLLIFTTSGDLANYMMHPRFEIQREYAVRVLGELTMEQKKQLLDGLELDDGPARFERLADAGGEGQNHWYRVILKEGRNREVRRMFEFFGLTVSRLMRVRFGAIELPPRLKRGQFYELSETEVLGVMKWADLRINGQEKTH